MEKIIVHGGHRLEGTVEIEGAKNAVLPILAASILASEGRTFLSNVPILSDVYTMSNVIRFLNVQVGLDESTKTMVLDATGNLSYEAPFKYVSKMRASIVVLGPLLARLGHAKVAMPGGCAIGSRPIDLHLKGLEAMGVEIERHDGYIEARTDCLKGANIYLDFPSVGATQNIMMAATLAKGTTIIENVAREPEIVDLANVLNKMGAKVYGAGTETIKVVGVDHLHGTEHTIIQDRIEAGTFMVAAALTKGNVLIKDAIVEHNKPLISKLEEMGVRMEIDEDEIYVPGGDVLSPVNIKTSPFPGFATDLQQPITPLLMQARGSSTIIDTLYPERTKHIPEMQRMGAKISSKDGIITVGHSTDLSGTVVEAGEIRAGVSLVGLALMAKGTTVINKADNILRGYDRIVEKFRGLSVDLEVINESESLNH